MNLGIDFGVFILGESLWCEEFVMMIGFLTSI